MKPLAPSRRGVRSSRVAVFALILAFAASATLLAFVLRKPRPSAAPAANSWTALSSSTAAWYLRSRQWSADARTLLAAARWMLDADPPATFTPTNLTAAPALSATNSSAHAPAA